MIRRTENISVHIIIINLVSLLGKSNPAQKIFVPKYSLVPAFYP